jgi:phospholipase C
VGMNILARTRLAGDIIIGQPITGPWKDLCLSSSAPQTIVYNEPQRDPQLHSSVHTANDRTKLNLPNCSHWRNAVLNPMSLVFSHSSPGPLWTMSHRP